MEIPKIEEALAKIPALLSSNHEKPTKAQIEKANVQACVMEAVAFIAGEPWSDHPECTCPVITAFMIRWNDRLSSDDLRNDLLRPLIPLLIGARSTPKVAQARAYLAVDWSVRWRTPKLCRIVGLNELATKLEALEPITDAKSASSARDIASSARAAAYQKRTDAWNRLRARFPADAAAVAVAVAADADAAAAAAAAYADAADAAAAAASADAYAAYAAEAAACAAYAAAAYSADAAVAAAAVAVAAAAAADADAAAADAAAYAAAYAAAAYAAVDADAAAYAAADAAAAYADADADAAADAADAAYAYAYAAAQPPVWFKEVLEAAKRGGYPEAYRVALASFEARERIAPISLEINASAQDLVRRMCALKAVP